MADPDPSSQTPEDSDATRLFTPRAVQAVAFKPGAVLGNTYVIKGLLGRGGMGEVYRATHVELGTEHAIKVMLPSLAGDPQFVQLFREEARKLGRVNDDAIVDYEGFFRDAQGLRYLVTEFVHGESLEQILRRRRLEPDEVLQLRDRLALGLAAAHDIGIVHRDVSPENILVPEGKVGLAKLIDFGIAKSMSPANVTLIGGEFAGKHSFASPEQVGLFGGQVDLRSDIYSLGLVLAAAAIGFGRKLDMGSSAATMIAARQRVPDLSAVPASLRPLIAPMLEPRPDHRPPSMRALPGDGSGASRGTGAKPATGATRSWKARVIRSFGIAAGLIMLGAAALAILRAVSPGPTTEELRERVAAAMVGYRCSSLDYAVGPDRSIRVSGYVANPADIDGLRQAVKGISGIARLDFNVALRIWPYCEALKILQPLIEHPPRAAATLSLSPPGGEAQIGQPLLVDVRTPSFDGYVYVDYLDGDGEVMHLFPNSRDRLNFRPARNHIVLGKPPLERCWILGGNTGEQLLILVAAPERLFADDRPEVEAARVFLPTLAQAVSQASAGDSTAAVTFFQLHNALPVGAGVNGCR